MIKRHLLAAMALTFGLGMTGPSGAAVPGRITEQGRLFLKGSNSPATGSVAMVFTLYAAPTGGQSLWSESYNLTLDDGYYSVQLGSMTPFPAGVWDGSVRYLGLKVAGDEEMTPREEIAAVPYALMAGEASGDIHPTSVSIGSKRVIDASGKWVGDPSGLQGPPGKDGVSGAACNNGCVTRASIAPGALNHQHDLGVSVVMTTPVPLAAGGGMEIFANCPKGTVLTGGGCNYFGGTSPGALRLIASYPGDFNNSDPALQTSRWTCNYENTNPLNSAAATPTIRSYALCAAVATATLP